MRPNDYNANTLGFGGLLILWGLSATFGHEIFGKNLRNYFFEFDALDSSRKGPKIANSRSTKKTCQKNANFLWYSKYREGCRLKSCKIADFFKMGKIEKKRDF